jgi:putative hydrolase of HD superfamily
MNDKKELTKFLFELGQMWRVKHCGWTIAGVANPESIAEHSHRAAQIAFILAKMEGADPYKTSFMVLIHDNGEARINDAHRIVTRYVDTDKGEVEAALDQFRRLPENIKKDYKEVYEEFEERKTLEAKCAKDADYLEQAVAAKEYIDIGYKGCINWIENIKKALMTNSAKELLKEIERMDRNEWSRGLSKMKK